LAAEKGGGEDILRELRHIRKLLISSLIVSGVGATTITKILGFKRASSITNEIPVGVLKKTIPVVKLQSDAQTEAPVRKRRRRR
jgi:hypothetical protein